MGTAATGDDKELITGVDVSHPLGTYFTGGDTDGDHLLDNDETWTFQYTVDDLVLNAGDFVTTSRPSPPMMTKTARPRTTMTRP